VNQRELRLEAEELFSAYAHCLDDDRVEEWPDFFTDTGSYKIIGRDNVELKLPIATMLCTSKAMMTDRVVAIRNVTVNEPQFVGHFPGRPIMPGVLIIEAMAQVGGVLAFKSNPDPDKKLVYFSGIEKAKFRKPVIPGDRLRFEVTVIQTRPPFWKMSAQAYVEDQLVCEAELMAMLSDK